jgi:hypothetical protein
VQGNCTAPPADALLQRAKKTVSPESLEPLHPGQCLIILTYYIFDFNRHEEASRGPGFVDNLYVLAAEPDGHGVGIFSKYTNGKNPLNMYILRTTLDGVQYETGGDIRAYVEGE